MDDDAAAAASLPERAAVVVIGGGIAGTSAALRLAELGFDPVLLERDRVASGASGSSVGACVPCWPLASPDAVETLLGPERGGEFNRLLVRAPGVLDAWLDAYGIRALRYSGAVTYAAHDAAAARTLAALGDAWQARGARVTWADAGRVRARHRSDVLGPGLVFEDCRLVDPAALVRGLAAAGRARGVRLHEHTAVQGVVAAGEAWDVRTARGTVRTDHVLVATDMRGAALAPDLERTAFVLPYAELRGRIAAGESAADDAIADTFAPQPLFAHRAADGTLLASLPVPPLGARTPAALGRRFERRWRRVWPRAPRITWESAWVGRVTCSATGLPVLARFARGLHAIGGFTGYGLLTGIQWGRAYAEGLADPSGLAPLESPPRPVPTSTLGVMGMRIAGALAARFADRSYADG